MGQHKHNPTAMAAARGELNPVKRDRPIKSVSSFIRSVLAIVGIGGKRPYYQDRHGSIRRTVGKVKGKANVKRAKKARRLAREFAALKAAA